MIIKKSFFTHWKTRLLIRLNGGDRSVLIDLQELWAHCEESKAWEFEGMDAKILAMIANTCIDPDEFESFLLESRFIYRDGDLLVFNDWDEHNSGLVANWENGKKGGRPKKPMGNPTKPMGNPTKPMGNPRVTQAKPNETHGEPCSVVKSSVVKSSVDDNTARSRTSPDSMPEAIKWDSENGFQGITDKDREQWLEAYPACDITRQLASANQWLLANPAKAKKKAWRRFVTGWLSRSQERGGDTQSNKPGTMSLEERLSWSLPDDTQQSI